MMHEVRTQIRPGPEDAGAIAREVLGQKIARVSRLTNGAGNWVYDVTSERGVRAVVRIMRCRNECAAAMYWSKRLRPLGVPLPELLAWHVPETDQQRGWMVIERFEGRDLGNVYCDLDPVQKLAILERVMRAQEIVHALPQGNGFGWVNMPEEAPHRTFRDMMIAGLHQSRKDIERMGVVDPRHVERVERMVPELESYFATVRPTPFLDDTTTRNVIVNDGRLSGIVDVDGICYGDALLTVALTRMALLSLNCDTIYTDEWLERLKPTVNQRRAFDFYTAFFCINFLAEQGQQFNLDAPPAVDPGEVERLENLLDRLFAGRV